MSELKKYIQDNNKTRIALVGANSQGKSHALLSLNDDKELIRAIIATIRGHDSNVFYTSEVNGAIRVKNNRYTVPETTFRRRKG